MIDDLISRGDLVTELNNSHFPGAPYVDAGISIAIGKVMDAQPIDKRKTGKWIPKLLIRCEEHIAHNGYECSECGYWNPMGIWKYCPNCGSENEEDNRNDK